MKGNAQMVVCCTGGSFDQGANNTILAREPKACRLSLRAGGSVLSWSGERE